MRKIILALFGAALLTGAMADVAYAKERHHSRSVRSLTSQHFRNSNAGEIPAFPQPSFSGAGAWGSMTGFN